MWRVGWWADLSPRTMERLFQRMKAAKEVRTRVYGRVAVMSVGVWWRAARRREVGVEKRKSVGVSLVWRWGRWGEVNLER